jgi:hypothetical protein
MDIFDTMTDAEAATVAAGQNTVLTGGYAIAGDGGGALYRRVAAEPAHNGKFQSADGAWWELSEKPADIRMFGASTTASAATNAAAVNGALAYSQLVVAPPGVFDVGATIFIPFRTTLRGAGRQQTFLNKTFNGDMVSLGSAANLEDIALLGNGTTYSGRGVTIGLNSGAQWISRVSITDFNDYCVEYTVGSAGTQGGLGEGCMLGRTHNGDVCVKYPDDALAASPRYLIDVLCTGHYALCDTGGAQNLFVQGGYCGNIVFGPDSGKVMVWGTRIALTGETMTVQGADLIMDGCPIAGNVIWQAGAGSSFGPNNILAGTFTDNTNSGLVSKLYYIGTSFAPSWRADTTDPAIGNGALTGEIAGHGKFRRYTVSVITGTTTTFGSGLWYFPLKGSNERAKTTAIGTVYGLDAGTAFRAGACYILAGDNKIRFVSEGAQNDWSSAIPHVWAYPDYFLFCIDVELT